MPARDPEAQSNAQEDVEMVTMTDRREAQTGQELILAARGVSKAYEGARSTILVLDTISLELRSGEFVALLGPSGSGKSTLLRILAGLVPATSGEVLVHGAPLRGTNPQVAMVFQTFALYPWLTVVENVELGLLERGLSPAERRTRAIRAIDLIGLDGFEEAYPKELSGGMRQRVGFARALVVEPEVLFMDEPFSALDVLTAGNLRHELLDLWRQRTITTRAVLLVTHNIEEAVTLADRLLVFAADPGRVRVEVPGLPLDMRQRQSAERARLVDSIYRIMTNPEEDAAALLPGARSVQEPVRSRAYQALPPVSIGDLTGFIERLAGLGGREDVYELADELQREADELLPLVEAADVLGFADVQEGDVFLTDLGRQFAEAGVQEEKQLFRRQAIASIELIRQIIAALGKDPDSRVPKDPFLERLERFFSPPEARHQVDIAIDWGRYAELFAFDDDTGQFFLEQEAAMSPPQPSA
jgi:NitT/TauT family transport system ATP-binding protein